MPSSAGQTCALDRKSTRLNSSHTIISYAVFCLEKKPAVSARRLAPSVTVRRDARAPAAGEAGPGGGGEGARGGHGEGAGGRVFVFFFLDKPPPPKSSPSPHPPLLQP